MSTNANFKQVKLGQRFRWDQGVGVKIRPCVLDGQMRNAVLITPSPEHMKDRLKQSDYWTIGNIPVTLLEETEK